MSEGVNFAAFHDQAPSTKTLVIQEYLPALIPEQTLQLAANPIALAVVSVLGAGTNL